MFVCACVHVCVCVCVCVCVRESERVCVCVCEREWKSVCVCVRERESERVCVWVCVCEREWKRVCVCKFIFDLLVHMCLNSPQSQFIQKGFKKTENVCVHVTVEAWCNQMHCVSRAL